MAVCNGWWPCLRAKQIWPNLRRSSSYRPTRFHPVSLTLCTMTGNSEYMNSKVGVICILRFECHPGVIVWFQHVLENIGARKYKIAIISPHVYLYTPKSRISIHDLPVSPEMYKIVDISQREKREKRINAVEACIGDDPAYMTSMPLSRSFDSMSVRLSLSTV